MRLKLPKKFAVLVQKGELWSSGSEITELLGRGLVLGLTERPDGVFVPQVRPLDGR
jgi:hypothetical protein